MLYLTQHKTYMKEKKTCWNIPERCKQKHQSCCPCFKIQHIFCYKADNDISNVHCQLLSTSHKYLQTVRCH